MRPVSDESERRLTGAIERAASAVAAGGGDCSGTLARELLAEGVFRQAVCISSANGERTYQVEELPC